MCDIMKNVLCQSGFLEAETQLYVPESKKEVCKDISLTGLLWRME